MKSENSKLLLGLGIGALVGAAVGYLMTGEHRRKLEEDLREVGHGIKDGARSVFSKVKAKTEHAGSKFADKAGEWSEEVGDKAQQWAGKAGDKAEEPTTFLRKQMISGKRWTTGLRLMNKSKPNMLKITGKT